ncbi:MAG TPA: radical SAM family heme chaperone HemW [Propionibacteriaceae bacterium]|nr:radical SAM family heme chaperone HemW [Propionibacteriaceae bacterium]
MAGPLPDGDPVPDDGALPASALAAGDGSLALYLHVPYCASRCGYCDFNTYTAAELGASPGASQTSYVDGALAEVALARRVLGPRRVTSIFVGGGTPTLLASDTLVTLVGAVDDAFGLADGAEVTTEANPESVTPDSLAALRAGGFTRVSFGMQSAVPHVLRTLDRVHTPGRAAEAVSEARAAGFGDVSLDLIYGTPGESLDDWRTSLEAALAAEPDHLSAYALIVEEGTPLARRIRRGELPAPDDDDLADKYLLADELLGEAGYDWYELSNWARPGHECRHNVAYWRSMDWWGIGAGAHSHVGGVRWWNVKHPAAYAQRLASGRSPGHAREVLTADQQRVEQVRLEIRLADGLASSSLSRTEVARVADLVERGLLVRRGDRLVLTLEGRLLADAVVRELLD